MERLGLVGPGTLLLADNVLVPGAPDFLAHVRAPQAPFGSGSGSSGSGSSDSGGDPLGGAAAAGPAGPAGGSGQGGAGAGIAWRTELVATRFEVEERFRQDWQPRMDAMAVSRCIPA